MAGTKRSSRFTDTAEILDGLIRRCYEEAADEIIKNIKCGDFLKMIELKHKLAPDKSGRDEFWKMLQEIRREKLGGKTDPKPGKTRPKTKPAKDE